MVLDIKTEKVQYINQIKTRNNSSEYKTKKKEKTHVISTQKDPPIGDYNKKTKILDRKPRRKNRKLHL